MDKLIITCIRGGRAGERFELAGDVVVLGRRPGNDVSFDAQSDTKASGRHAEIRREGGGFLIKDLGSTNGTWIGEQKVEGDVALHDGVNVEFGKGGPIYHVRIVSSDLDAAPGTVMADLAPPQEPEHSGRTAIYRAMMQETVQRSSRTLKWALAAVTLVLVGGGVGAWWYITTQREEAEARDRQLKETVDAQKKTNQELAEELEAQQDALNRTRKQLKQEQDEATATNTRLAAVRTQLETAQGEAKQKLEAQEKALEQTKADYELKIREQQDKLAALEKSGSAAETIVSANEKSLFMLIAKYPDHLMGFCTAFAVDATGLLATNAHCTRAVGEFDAEGVPTVARMNKHPDKMYYVKQWKAHSAYKNTAFSADVALVRIDLGGDTLPSLVTLAADETVRKLVAGQAIYTLGFPGQVMNPQAPNADFRSATISRLTTYDDSAGDPATWKMVWHSALTSKGTSGSPIFNAAGEVIAVNNGSLSNRVITTTDPATGQVRRDVAYDANGLAFGIRVDALRELLP